MELVKYSRCFFTGLFCLLTACQKSSPRYWNEYYIDREREKQADRTVYREASCPALKTCYSECAESRWVRNTDSRGRAVVRNTFRDGTKGSFWNPETLTECERKCRTEIFCTDKE